MSSDLSNRTWTYRQSSVGVELKLSTSVNEGGVYHSLLIASKSARARVEIDEQAIRALATTMVAIETKPICGDTFVINQSLSLTSEPPSFVLRNCTVSYRFPAFANLQAFIGRLQEAALIAQLWG